MSGSAHVLLLRCPDRPGLVAEVAAFVAAHGGNIVDADQHADAISGSFLQRIAFELPPGHDAAEVAAAFEPVADALAMDWELHHPAHRARVAVLVSQQGHCLYDLLARAAVGELAADVVAVVSNHDTHRVAAERFGVDFHLLPVDPSDPDGRASHRAAVADRLAELDPDLVVLARYMQIVAPEVIDRFPNRIINIHHSFLPAFVGARPYHQAHERGVKLVGATAHYVTPELDQGPIICQDVTPVSHRDDVERIAQRGRDLEQVVLARAVHLHLDHRVLCDGNRTVVFD